MAEGFFLNGVNMNSTGVSVGNGVELSHNVYL